MTSVGSPLYDVATPHVIALWALAALPILVWLFAAVAGGPVGTGSLAGGLLARYRQAPHRDRAIVWLLLASAAIHVGLALEPTHGGGGLRLAFAVQAGMLAVAVGRMLSGRSWRGLALVALVGAVVGYGVAVLAGEAPDQVGLATKLGEIVAIALILTTHAARRSMRLLGASAVIALVVLTDAVAWAGAVNAAGGSDAAAGVASHAIGSNDHADGAPVHDDGHSHGHGGVPGPGMVMAPPLDREPTEVERAAAMALIEAVRAGTARYGDLTVAAAAGYQVDAIAGTDHHAGNPGFEEDGRVLDPDRPETLVYAVDPAGRPVLMGAMFLMPSMDEPGPTIGGPLTVWHGHEQICFSVLPPAITGLLSPLGACPVGSIDLPRSAEMIHVWTAPGAPQPFGDLDPEWMAAYLRSTVAPST